MGLEAVTRAFTSYLEGDDRWRTSLAWHPFDLRAESGRQRRNTAALVAILIGILGAILLVLSR